jgi:hypothetical protein
MSSSAYKTGTASDIEMRPPGLNRLVLALGPKPY